MTYFEVTKENVETIPLLEWHFDKQIGDLFDSILIVPTDDIHDSGYRCMQHVLCKGSEAVKRIYRGSDVIHIDGIGGYGIFNGYIPEVVKPVGWSIDCTPNGFLRIFIGHRKIMVGNGLSDFDIYSVETRGE